MPTPSWPVSLPSPNLSGYGVDPAAAFIRTDMESGPARQRRRFSQVPEQVTASFRFTNSEMTTFRNFWKTNLFDGNASFTLNLDLGAGVVNYIVRFISPYRSARQSGMVWDVAVKVEVLNA